MGLYNVTFYDTRSIRFSLVAHADEPSLRHGQISQFERWENTKTHHLIYIYENDVLQI